MQDHAVRRIDARKDGIEPKAGLPEVLDPRQAHVVVGVQQTALGERRDSPHDEPHLDHGDEENRDRKRQLHRRAARELVGASSEAAFRDGDAFGWGQGSDSSR